MTITPFLPLFNYWLVVVLMMIGFSQLYYSFLSRAERINDLNTVVVDKLTNELFNIVAGRGSFEDGPQEELLRGVNDTLDSLIKEGAASRLELTVARRTGDTLGSYIKRLGEQMKRGATVEDIVNTIAITAIQAQALKS